MKNDFLEIPAALEQIKLGKMLILVDHTGRENEGDFFFPASEVTARKVNTAIKLGGGILCVALSPEIALRLDLGLMVSPSENTEQTGVNFAISVNAKNGISSGVSAFDRAKTIKILGNKNSEPGDLTKPGHVFPLVAHSEGLLKRQGHTEGAVALSALAGFTKTGVLCEILNKEGEMASRGELILLAKKLNIGIVSIDDLESYIKNHKTPSPEKSIIKTAVSKLPTKFGNFTISVYKSILDNKEHLALVLGKKLNNRVLTRIHSQCLTGDTLFSEKCDCGGQLRKSLEQIHKKGEGILIYLNQEGRGIGLTNKIKAYALQDKGLDTVEANVALGLPIDERDFKIAFEILQDLGVKKIDLLTNNPQKIKDMKKLGMSGISHIPLSIEPSPTNREYLLAKKTKLGHTIDF